MLEDGKDFGATLNQNLFQKCVDTIKDVMADDDIDRMVHDAEHYRAEDGAGG